jgi:hypothetical protein
MSPFSGLMCIFHCDIVGLIVCADEEEQAKNDIFKRPLLRYNNVVSDQISSVAENLDCVREMSSLNVTCCHTL